MNTELPLSPPPTDPDGTATDRVYEAIYLAVLEHRLAPGEWLREAEMATEFKVSRTVVRQALQRLAQDQVIELRHNRGARVPLPSLEDAVHVFEARRIVECEVARRLGGRLTPEQLAELRAVAQAEQAAEGRAFRERFTDHLTQLLGDDGVLVMPTMPDIAPRVADPESALEDYRNRAIRLLCVAGLSGFPQLSLPLARRAGAPLGFSLLGPRGSDRSLVRLAERITRGTGK